MYKRNYFTDEEIQELSKSKWVEKITEAKIYFTNEFKNEFIHLLNQGYGPSRALELLGINYKVLGKSRIDKLSARLKAQSKRPEGFNRKPNSSKGKKRKLTFDSTEAKAAYYEEYSKKLEQELDFTKKVRALEEKYIQNSARAKNSK